MLNVPRAADSTGVFVVEDVDSSGRIEPSFETYAVQGRLSTHSDADPVRPQSVRAGMRAQNAGGHRSG